MLMHQRYFPLYDAAGKLTNKFIIVSNGNPECAATIIDGNERVVRARLDDAKFFYEEDLKHPLESYIEKLGQGGVPGVPGHGAPEGRAPGEAWPAPFPLSAPRLDAAERSRCRSVPRCLCQGRPGHQRRQSSSPASRASWAATTPPASGENDRRSPRPSADALSVRASPAMRRLPPTVGQRRRHGRQARHRLRPVRRRTRLPPAPPIPFALRRSAIGHPDHASRPAWPVSPGRRRRRPRWPASPRRRPRPSITPPCAPRSSTSSSPAPACCSRTRATVSTPSMRYWPPASRRPWQLVKRVRALETARSEQPETFEDLATAFARANNLRDEEAGTQVDPKLMEACETALDDAVSTAQEKVAAALAANDYAAALASLAALRAPSTASSKRSWSWTRIAALRDQPPAPC